MRVQATKRSHFSLLIDFEATGLDPKKERIIEIGAVVVNNNDLEIQGSFHQLVWSASHGKVTEEIEKITGISQYALTTQGVKLEEALQSMEDTFFDLLDDVDYIVAYNKSYDETLIKAEIERLEIKGVLPFILKTKPWLCAMRDVEDNYNYKSLKLSHLSLDKGVAVDPKELHRALDDVLLMHKMLGATKVNLDEVYNFSVAPWIYLQAVIPAPWVDGGVGKDLAKGLGYAWEKCPGDDRVFEKRWIKRVKQNKVDGEKTRAPFRVEVV